MTKQVSNINSFLTDSHRAYLCLHSQCLRRALSSVSDRLEDWVYSLPLPCSKITPFFCRPASFQSFHAVDVENLKWLLVGTLLCDLQLQ